MPFCLSKHTSSRGSDLRGFPHGPAVKNLPSDAGDVHLILGKETMIPHPLGQLSPWTSTTEPPCSGPHTSVKVLHITWRPNKDKYINNFFLFFFKKEGLISVLCTGMNVWPHVTASWGGVKVVEAQSYLTLCDLLDCSPPGSSVHGILQARILEQVASPFSGDLPNLGMEP